MKNPEFSAQFDVLYNNITSNQAPALDEYEKSVFLTKGQDEVIKNYFSPKGNPKQDGFDDSPKRQHDFSTLIQTATLNPVVSDISGGGGIFDHRGLDYKYESDIFLVLNEQLYNKETNFIYTINPISFDEYNRVMQKPYKYPPKNQVWRLMVTNAVEAHEETVIVTVYETVEIPAEGELALASGTGSIGDLLDARSPWKSTSLGYTMGTTLACNLNIQVIDANYSTIDQSTYIRQYSPIVDFGRTGNIIIYLPDTLTLQQIYEYLQSSEYKATTENIWKYIDDLDFPTETSEMKEELHNYSDTTGLSLYGDTIEPVREQREVQRETVIHVPGYNQRTAELIGRWYGNTADLVYKVRYVKRPRPIILVDLADDFVEDGLGFEYAGEVLTKETECELPESLHSEILQRAVELAKIAWQGETQAIVTSGQRSE